MDTLALENVLCSDCWECVTITHEDMISKRKKNIADIVAILGGASVVTAITGQIIKGKNK